MTNCSQTSSVEDVLRVILLIHCLPQAACTVSNILTESRNLHIPKELNCGTSAFKCSMKAKSDSNQIHLKVQRARQINCQAATVLRIDTVRIERGRDMESG